MFERASDLYDNRFLLFEQSHLPGDKNWYQLYLCNNAIAIPSYVPLDQYDKPDFLEFLKEGHTEQKRVFGEFGDAEPPEDLKEWALQHSPYQFHLKNGLYDKHGECIDHDPGYLTLIVTDSIGLRKYPEKKPVVAQYIDLEWHQRQIEELKIQHEKEKAELESAIARMFVANDPTKFFFELGKRLVEGVAQGLNKRGEALPSDLEEIQQEKERLQKQIEHLEALEKHVNKN